MTVSTPLTDVVTLDKLVQRAINLRAELDEAGPELDATGADPTEEMRRCWEEGLLLPSIPDAYGGLSPDGSPVFGFAALAEIITALAAVDGALAQNLLTSHLVLREIFE